MTRWWMHWKKEAIEVEYMVKDNEGHGFYNEENQFDFYRSMEKFLNTTSMKPAETPAK